MNRRNSLLGSLSPSSGGGKLVNTITVKPYIEKFTLRANYYAQYPVKSRVLIDVATNGAMGQGTVCIYENTQEGTTQTEIDIMPESNEITVISVDPQEDENYIYEVVIEQ